MIECSAGQDVEDRSGILSNLAIAVVLLDNVIQCNRVVSTWQFWVQQSYAFKVIIYRQTETGTWTVVGVNDIPASEVRANLKSTYVVPYDDRVKVQIGDVIGIGQYTNNPILDASIPGSGTPFLIAVNPSTSVLLTNEEIFSLLAGSSVTAVSSASKGGTSEMIDVSLSAIVQPGMVTVDTPTTVV